MTGRPSRPDGRNRAWTHDDPGQPAGATPSPAPSSAGAALLALAAAGDRGGLVWFDRAAYTDSHDGQVTLIDAIYYATVTITTTGYGDITPVAPHSRIINAIVITPLRIGFLVLLVGTTLEVLANEGRRIILDTRWRKHMRNHVVVVGFGTKGRSAVETLQNNGTNPAQIVIIDSRPTRSATPTSVASPRSRVTRPGGRSCAGPRSSRPAR